MFAVKGSWDDDESAEKLNKELFPKETKKQKVKTTQNDEKKGKKRKVGVEKAEAPKSKKNEEGTVKKKIKKGEKENKEDKVTRRQKKRKSRGEDGQSPKKKPRMESGEEKEGESPKKGEEEGEVKSKKRKKKKCKNKYAHMNENKNGKMGNGIEKKADSQVGLSAKKKKKKKKEEEESKVGKVPVVEGKMMSKSAKKKKERKLKVEEVKQGEEKTAGKKKVASEGGEMKQDVVAKKQKKKKKKKKQTSQSPVRIEIGSKKEDSKEEQKVKKKKRPKKKLIEEESSEIFTMEESSLKKKLNEKVIAPVTTVKSPFNMEILKQKLAAAKDDGSAAKITTDKGRNDLYRKMKKRLSAGSFRYLNEQLYTIPGNEAYDLFQRERESFDLYHEGYQSQVSKWPLNPVDLMVEYISKKSSKLIVADFGCGDAKISLTVENVVHSFDFVALNERVTACDMSDVPLQDSTVDIAVFCLSLMGTNLADYLCEANRVLRQKGKLLVAEVKSRFEKVGSFVRKMRKMGFELNDTKDDNKMFIWLEFTKVSDSPPDEVVPNIELLPCIYKKR